MEPSRQHNTSTAEHHGPPSSTEGAFFTNLLLLGFDVLNNEKKHNIQFHPQMFATSNVKGMQVVLHFLFKRLSPDKAEKVMC